MKHAFGIVLFLICSVSFGQIKTENLSLEKGNHILNTLQIPNNAGVLIKTGKKGFNTTNLNWKLNYYSPEMKLIYSIPLEKTQINKAFRNYLIASTNSKVVYHIEPKGYNTFFGASNMFLTQINETGNKKTFELDKIKDLGKRKAVFADNKYFYYFTNLKVKNETTNKNEISNLLVRLSAADFSRTDIPLAFPKLKDEYKSSEWNYSGNFDNAIYFTSKTVLDDGTYIYDVVLIDNNGKFLKNFTIDAKIKSSTVRPSHNKKYFYWADFVDNDFDCPSEQSSVYDTEGINYLIDDHEAKAYIGALGDIIFDPQNNAIYIYGLCGPGQYNANKLTCPTKGYFIQKYDINGKNIWKKEYEFSEKLQEDIYLRGSGFAYRRKILLNMNNPEIFTLEIKSSSNIFSFNLESSTGKFTTFYSNKFNSYRGTRFLSTYDLTKSSDLNTFLSTRFTIGKDTYYTVFHFNQSSIVIEDDVKTKSVKIMSFK